MKKLGHGLDNEPIVQYEVCLPLYTRVKYLGVLRNFLLASTSWFVIQNQ